MTSALVSGNLEYLYGLQGLIEYAENWMGQDPPSQREDFIARGALLGGFDRETAQIESEELWTHLPPELFMEILKLLSLQGIKNLSGTCRLWRGWINKEKRLWRAACLNVRGFIPKSTPSGVYLREFVLNPAA